MEHPRMDRRNCYHFFREIHASWILRSNARVYEICKVAVRYSSLSITRADSWQKSAIWSLTAPNVTVFTDSVRGSHALFINYYQDCSFDRHTSVIIWRPTGQKTARKQVCWFVGRRCARAMLRGRVCLTGQPRGMDVVHLSNENINKLAKMFISRC